MRLYLLHAGEPLLGLQSGGRRDLQTNEGVQRQRIQEQVLRWAFQPHCRALFLQHGLRVRMGASGGHHDGTGRAGGSGGTRRPGDAARTVLRREYASAGRAAIFSINALAPLGVQLSLHLRDEQ